MSSAAGNDVIVSSLLNQPSVEGCESEEGFSTSPPPVSLGPRKGLSLMEELGQVGEDLCPNRSEQFPPRVNESQGSSFDSGMEPSNPERVFKLVFVGDSGVGKTCFIHRFCFDRFKPTFSATVGVDFQVKSMFVDGHCIALQLWDTAGQERWVVGY